MKKQKDSIILTGAKARKAERVHRELRAIIDRVSMGGLSRTEREYRTPAQLGMTLAEIREGRLPMPYTVVSEKRGDLWDFTTRREAETFVFLMELEDRDNHDYKEGRYTVRENPPPTEEQRKAYIAEAMRLLGQSKSPRKAAASRANGKKGGRPRKEE